MAKVLVTLDPAAAVMEPPDVVSDWAERVLLVVLFRVISVLVAARALVVEKELVVPLITILSPESAVLLVELMVDVPPR